MSAAGLLGWVQVAAQPIPDAGSVLRQIEERERSEPPVERSPEFAPAPSPLESIGGTTVTVSEFRFAGNSLLAADELAPHLASFLGRPLDFSGLQNAAIVVATAYRNAGWVVRAYLPQQDVTGGVVTIQIVEARFGRVRFDGVGARVSQDRLRRIVEKTQARGAPVSAARLDRSLLLMNDLAGVSAVGRLAAGEADAETDLVIATEDGAPVNGGVTLDNAGARYTGEGRLIANVALNNRLGVGDRADVLLLHSEGSSYLRAGYSVPVGSAGWRVGANASHLDYEIVTDEFAALEAEGQSTAFGLEASYPLIRSRLTSLYLDLDVRERRFDNESLGASTSDYSVRGATVGIRGSRFDDVLGGGVTTAYATLLSGDVDLAGSPNEAADALTTKTAGGFRKIGLAASRLQVVSERISLLATVERQLASQNLDSSEKLFLGGSQGVRAYPESEASGSEGTMVTVEMRTRLSSNLQFTPFVDWGKVHVNKDSAFLGAPERNSVQLRGAGVSLGWTAPFGLYVNATFARRAGDNPNAAVNGDDQDGSLVKNRVWLQVSMPF